MNDDQSKRQSKTDEQQKEKKKEMLTISTRPYRRVSGYRSNIKFQ